MFRKVHLRLTLLCVVVTILIIGSMSTAYLYISEKNLRDTYFSSFQNDMNTLLSNLGNQSVITHRWLSWMEGNGKYIIDVRDNGVDFLWNSYTDTAHPERRPAIDAGWDYYNSHFSMASGSSFYSISHQEFSFSQTGSGPDDYYGCVAVFSRDSGTLSFLILKPLSPLTVQIAAQRRAFVVPVLAACAFLWLFFWYFTRKLLSPIEESRQSQIRFVAAASHELRTPLSVILSAADACKKAKPAEQDKFFAIISDEGKSMSRLISSLLMLAGADSHSFSLQKENCEMDTLLLDTFEAFEPLAQKGGHALSVLLPDHRVAPLYCDGDRIRQVLSILLHNAFSHTPAGSHIRLSLKDTPKELSLSVSDNGPGIPDDKKARIFERFYRADNARPDSPDSHFGLGLSIAGEILHAHGGSIRVFDTPGGGATFTLTLRR